MKNGKRIPEAMQKINWALRDWRKDEATEMDPDLIDLIWEIHAELGSNEPIHVISGFRSRGTNDMLRRTVGGQASESRHILGKAMDVQFPGRAGEEAALLGPHPRARRRRLLPDLGHAVRAHRHRPRARLAAPAACGAGLALPQGPHPAPAERRRADHAGGRAPGARRSHGACRADRRVPPAAHAAEDAGAGRLADALAAAAACRCRSSSQRPPAMGTRPSDAERARLAALAAEPTAAPRRRADAGASQPASRRGAWGEMRVASADPAAGSGEVGESTCKRGARRSAATPRSCRRPPTTRSTPRSCPTAPSRSRRS